MSPHAYRFGTLVTVLSLAASVRAQTARVCVTDARAEPLPFVHFTNGESGAATDETGCALLPSPGVWRVSAVGFRDTSVVVAARQVAPLVLRETVYTLASARVTPPAITRFDTDCNTEPDLYLAYFPIERPELTAYWEIGQVVRADRRASRVRLEGLAVQNVFGGRFLIAVTVYAGVGPDSAWQALAKPFVLRRKLRFRRFTPLMKEPLFFDSPADFTGRLLVTITSLDPERYGMPAMLPSETRRRLDGDELILGSSPCPTAADPILERFSPGGEWRNIREGGRQFIRLSGETY